MTSYIVNLPLIMVTEMNGKYDRGEKTILDVLGLMAFAKEVYQYDITKTISPSPRTVIRTLQELKKNELITLVRTEPSMKQGREKNVWSITTRGLLTFLCANVDAWKKIEELVEIHREKFLVFQKWGFFKNEGVQGDVLDSLKIAVSYIATAQLQLLSSFGKRIKYTDKELPDLVDSLTLGCYELRETNQPKQPYCSILNAALSDEDMKKFIVTELEKFRVATKNSLDRIDQHLNVFRGNKKVHYRI